jgi:hypothetical protein
MVVVSMKWMPPKAIGRKVCLHARGHYELLKDFKPKKCPYIWRREELKEAKDFMKVEDGCVHRNKYKSRCMKHKVKIPKVT